jgi:hypothetical protein
MVTKCQIECNSMLQWVKCDFLLLMDVNEYMSYECSEYMYQWYVLHLNIRNFSTHSHSSEEENRTYNRSKNCKCKRALKLQLLLKLRLSAIWGR